MREVSGGIKRIEHRRAIAIIDLTAVGNEVHSGLIWLETTGLSKHTIPIRRSDREYS